MYAGFTRHACPSTIYAVATICCRISNQRFAPQTNTVYTCMTPKQITTPINPHLSGKSTANNANCRKLTISGRNLQPSASRYASKFKIQTDFVNGRCSRRSSNSPNRTSDIASMATRADAPHASPCGMAFQGECSESFATQMDQFLPFTWLQNGTQNGPHPLDNPYTYPPSEYTNTINTETLHPQEANHLRSRRQVQHRGRQDPSTEPTIATTKRHAA